MATLQMFMTLEELDETIRGFAAQHNLIGILRTQEGYSSYNITEQPSEFLNRHKDVIHVYLLPKGISLPTPLAEETFLPRQIGAIQISPGGLIRSGTAEVLLLTSLSAEDKQGLAFKPVAWLRQLKKRMQAEGRILFGVEGVNTVFGGQATYKDIGYSTSAIQLYHKGVLWKQYVDDNGEFAPIT